MFGKLSVCLMALAITLFSIYLPRTVSAQQCNVQQSASVQASQAQALQNAALNQLLQSQQLSQLQTFPVDTSAVAVAGGNQAQRFAVVPSQRVAVQAPLQLKVQAPAPRDAVSSAASTASALAIPAPQPQLALVPVAAVQASPSLLACRPKLFGGRARTQTSRSVAITRTRG